MDAAVTLDEALAMDEAYSGMLEVACLLAEKAASRTLSPEERQVHLVMRVDCQVCNGGWEQWMFNTEVSALSATPAALLAVDCVGVHGLATTALGIAGLDSFVGDDEHKQAVLTQLSTEAREALSKLDDAFYSPVEDYMAKCKAYVIAHRSCFDL